MVPPKPAVELTSQRLKLRDLRILMTVVECGTMAKAARRSYRRACDGSALSPIVADYYYYPGFHEPGSNNTLGINKALWEALAPSERALIEAAAHAEVTRSLARFNAENVRALKQLRADE